jgi:hypothetical protein
MFGGNENHHNMLLDCMLFLDIHKFLCIWSGDITPDLPNTNNLYFIMYFILIFLCVIHLCLLNYHMIYLLSLLMTGFFKCYQTILVYFFIFY